MKIKAAVTAGLINGIVIGVSLHWILVGLLYETVFGFTLPDFVSTSISILAFTAFGVSLLSIGPHTVLQAKGTIQTKGEGFLVGAGAGLIVGLVVFLAVGVLAVTLILGTVPLIEYLAEPARLTGTKLYDILQPVVSTAIAGIYVVIVGHLFLGGLIGGIESIGFFVLQGWRTRNSSRSP